MNLSQQDGPVIGEVTQYPEPPIEAVFRRMDRDGDGKLSWDEFKTRGATRAEFDGTDTD